MAKLDANIRLLQSYLAFTKGRISVRNDKIMLMDGSIAEYTYLDRKGGVVILPIYSDGRILLVNQYRYLVKKNCWELPAGGIEDGETPINAAIRELGEETALRANKWTEFVIFYPSNGISNEIVYMYLATSLESQDWQTDGENEISDYQKVRLNDIHDMLASGKILGASSIIALQHLLLNKEFIVKAAIQ